MMNTNNDVVLERLARIAQYKKITAPDFIPGPKDVLEVDHLKIPFSELSLKYQGCEDKIVENECRWYYLHESTNTVYILSASYDFDDELVDIQVKSVKGADVDLKGTIWSEGILSYMKDIVNSVDAETPEQSGSLADCNASDVEMVVAKFKELLIQQGYQAGNISCNLIHRWGGILQLKLLHTGMLENPELISVVKSALRCSFNKRLVADGDRQVFEYEFQLDQIKNFLHEFKLGKCSAINLIENVYSSLVAGFCSQFSHFDELAAPKFKINGGLLSIEFFYLNGEQEHDTKQAYSLFQILTKEDLEMAEFLVTLNWIGKDEEDGAIIMINLMRYLGLEKFGYKLTEEEQENKVTWLANPSNCKWLRKERIQRLLEGL